VTNSRKAHAYWGEEIDFSFPLKAPGKKLVYIPNAKVFHLGQNSGGSGNKMRFNGA
jgi:GT2 family glycosyltransferase